MTRILNLLAAFLVAQCGPVLAQSSVTLTGSLDAMAGRFTGSLAGVNSTDKAVRKVEGGGLNTSFLAFRGTEDLGSGLSASFDLSSFIRNDIGQSGRSDAIGPPVNVAADPFFSRTAWVGLSSRQFGRVLLGTRASLLFLNTIASNAFVDSTTFSPLNLVSFIGGPQAGGTGWTNQVIYESPNLAGFSFAGAISPSEGQGGRNTSARAVYAADVWGTSFAWANVKKNPATFADGTTSNNTVSWQLAAWYDFKLAKLFAHVGRIQNNGTETAPLDVGYRVWDLSASVPIGSGYVLAGYASRRTGDAVGPVPVGVAGGNKDRRVFSLGYDYFLSKRTDIYAMALHDRTVTNTLPGPPRLVTATGTDIAVGFRHRF